MVAGCGCPSVDRKVVNSGKRLRAHVGIDEGDVTILSSLNIFSFSSLWLLGPLPLYVPTNF